MSTQQDQTIAVANQLFTLANNLSGIASQIAVVSSTWSNLSAANKLNAMATAAAATTGGLGSADGSSVVTNPIDTRVSGQASLSKAISANNISSILTFLQGVQSAINGSAVSANGAAPQLLALCS